MKQYLLSNSSLTQIQDLTRTVFDVGLKLILRCIVEGLTQLCAGIMYLDSSSYNTVYNDTPEVF